MLNPHCFVADKQIEFSIIAPFRSSWSASETWLKSLLMQGHHQLTEVILVLPEMDASEYLKSQWEKLLDCYYEEIESSPYRFSFLTAIQGDDASSFNGALNEAVRVANGEWIYISQTDNQLFKSAFFEFTAAIKEAPDIELISCRFNRLNDEQQVIEKSPMLESEGFVTEAFKYHFLYQNPLRFGSTLFRKYLWYSSGGLKPELADAALWELLRRLAHGCFRWFYVPRSICNVAFDEETGQLFRHSGQLSQSFLKLIGSRHACYSRQEMDLAQQAIARQLFQYINNCFQNYQYAQGYNLIFELLQSINLGDRQWLDCLRKMDKSQIQYKQEIFNIIQVINRRCLI
ncbi:hypothetical protein Lepto7376_4422 [[Leptolyngbya] sp. PCC 7376]|uniref:hypothetical protein n=1 Tax=[Leptolyngbya] sp. PCC 7376 TaxID=111781 RepID=UPI00029F4945|nr:hypothetical protein [[Leptolyngbya] sp. PCC 7376]AFY40530.1 hypothetical protein Lepto7376_4422 [[Leptolyngbya] sp. PCC 7376]